MTFRSRATCAGAACSSYLDNFEHLLAGVDVLLCHLAGSAPRQNAGYVAQASRFPRRATVRGAGLALPRGALPSPRMRAICSCWNPMPPSDCTNVKPKPLCRRSHLRQSMKRWSKSASMWKGCRWRFSWRQPRSAPFHSPQILARIQQNWTFCRRPCATSLCAIRVCAPFSNTHGDCCRLTSRTPFARFPSLPAHSRRTPSNRWPASLFHGFCRWSTLR